MKIIRMYLTLMFKENIDKVSVWLLNQGLEVKASSSGGKLAHIEDDILSCLMVADITVSDKLIQALKEKLKEANKEYDTNSYTHHLTTELKKFLTKNKINFYSVAMQAINEAGANWDIGNVKINEKNGERKYRHDDEEPEE